MSDAARDSRVSCDSRHSLSSFVCLGAHYQTKSNPLRHSKSAFAASYNGDAHGSPRTPYAADGSFRGPARCALCGPCWRCARTHHNGSQTFPADRFSASPDRPEFAGACRSSCTKDRGGSWISPTCNAERNATAQDLCFKPRRSIEIPPPNRRLSPLAAQSVRAAAYDPRSRNQYWRRCGR